MSDSASPSDARLSRRTVLAWFAAAAAVQAGCAGMSQGPDRQGPTPTPPARPAQAGYGTDPNLTAPYHPGLFWPLTFTPAQHEAVTALADLILPADHYGPAASQLRIPDFIDEWVSAPYPVQQGHRTVFMPGLAWLEKESHARFTLRFAELTLDQQRAIADDICCVKKAKPRFADGAAFFALCRSLAASAYYATEPGWAAIGYIGNVPLARFDGPPPEVLARLGLT